MKVLFLPFSAHSNDVGLLKRTINFGSAHSRLLICMEEVTHIGVAHISAGAPTKWRMIGSNSTNRGSGVSFQEWHRLEGSLQTKSSEI